MLKRTQSVARVVRDRAKTPGTAAVLVGSLASGVGAYLFQVVGTRTLGEESYAPIGILWTIQYLALTVTLVGVEAYVARTATLHENEPEAVRRAILTLFPWVIAVSVSLGVGSWVWREDLFHHDAVALPLVVALTVFGYGMFVVIRGRLAGLYRFRQYGVVTATESLIRLGAAVLAALLWGTTTSLAWTLPVGPFVVVVWWLAVRRRYIRRPANSVQALSSSPVLGNSASRYLVATTVANGVSQILLAGGPLVLIPLGAVAADISLLFITITAARVPLVFVFGGIFSRILPPLTRAAAAGQFVRLYRLSILTTLSAFASAAVGAAAGAALGPQLFTLFFGSAFRPEGWLVAITVTGVVVATAALGLNQVLIAMRAEARMLLPWGAALLAGGLTVAMTGNEPMFRVISGFAVGEIVALLGLLGAVLTARPPGSSGTTVDSVNASAAPVQGRGPTST